MPGLISIVVPMMNEEGNVDRLIARLNAVATQIRARHDMATEVVINDNCSSDRTLDELRSAAARQDPSVMTLRIYRFSRNIGFQRSILVGYRKALGDAVAQIDADLQDPPELLLDFIAKWRDGNHVVYGVRRLREESIVMLTLRRLFYRVINRLSEDDLPRDAGDFRLVDRSVVDVVCAINDKDPYLRGAIASLGLRQIGVRYDRSPRQHGQSKFGFGQLFKLAIDGITNHTTLPLRLASYLALSVSAVAAVLTAYYLYGWVTHAAPFPIGFMTQTLLQLGTLAAVALLFAIQGFYIQRIYNQLKEKPLAIIEHSITQGGGELRPIEVLWIGRNETMETTRHAKIDADRAESK